MRGNSPPENLFQTPVMVVPAEVPPYRFWAVYELLDQGPVAHARYAGLLPRIEGEIAEALMTRVTGLVAQEG